MNSINVLAFRSPEDYETVHGYLEKFSVMVLHWSATQTGQETKEEIIWNFVAKGTVLLDSIFSLWQKENFQDCWILSRALFDRYIYLKDISEKNEFEAFEQWSNQMQFKDAHNALSDPQIRKKLTPEALEKAKEIQKERRKSLVEEPKSLWQRPRSEEVLKRSNLLSLHRLGHHFPSSQVHPMADDGKYDFYKLVGFKHPATDDTSGWAHEIYGEPQLILHNSLLHMLLLVKIALDSSDLQWKDFVIRFYIEILEYLEGVDSDYISTFQNAFALGPHHSWCEQE